VRLFTVAAGLGLALLVPRAASADYLDFTVNETSVPGTIPNTFTADLLNGAYTERITFDAFGNFTTSAYADFGQYFSNEGSILQVGNLNNFGTNGYGIYATFTSTGTFSGGVFTGDTAEAHLFIDPNQDTTKGFNASNVATLGGTTSDDYEILSASTLLSGTGFFLPNQKGEFALIFFNPLLTSCAALSTQCGEAYWPTLKGLTLITDINGDFNNFPTSGTQELHGDVSIVFTPVPEPATLTLMGLGLLGTAALIRRKRKNASL
jgi:hypothetical protein